MPTVNGQRNEKRMPAAGRRVEAAIRAAMAGTRDTRTITTLCEVAHVQRATVYALFAGRPPKPGTMEALALALRVSVGSLWAAWDGADTAPQPLVAAVDALSAAVARLADVLTARPDAEAQEARLRAIEAELSHLARRGGGASPERSSPRASAR